MFQLSQTTPLTLKSFRLFDVLPSSLLVVPATHKNAPHKLLKIQAKLNRCRIKFLTFTIRNLATPEEVLQFVTGKSIQLAAVFKLSKNFWCKIVQNLTFAVVAAETPGTARRCTSGEAVFHDQTSYETQILRLFKRPFQDSSFLQPDG